MLTTVIPRVLSLTISCFLDVTNSAFSSVFYPLDDKNTDRENPWMVGVGGGTCAISAIQDRDIPEQ